MQYVVHGVDNDGVSDHLEVLAEKHWAYMDRYAEQLMARGPMLSSDGTSHTGSVHVIETATIDEARQLAFQEPYWLEGLYASVTVTRMQSALDGSMWDRPPASTGRPSTLVLMSWPAEPCTPAARSTRTLTMLAEQELLVFGGLLVSEDATQSVGLAAALDVDMVEAERVMATGGLPETATSTVRYRWRRGGRQPGGRATRRSRPR